MKNISLIFIIATVWPMSTFAAFQTDTQNGGLSAEAGGDIEQALEIWEHQVTDENLMDVESGFDYIRLATEQQMTGSYEKASELYYQALYNAMGSSNNSSIREEIERLRPITGEGVHRQWVNAWETGDQELFNDLLGFWVRSDPTPRSEYNQRLIEHWERVAYSRSNFDKNRQSPYDSDDRALIYVRYGEPDEVKKGVLRINEEFISRRLVNFFQNLLLMSNDPDASEPDASDETDDNDEVVRQLESFVLPFHENPEYEIWIYSSETVGTDESLIFIFGTDARTGEFRRLKSIDDVIPSRAFGANRITTFGNSAVTLPDRFTPAFVLQLIYYRQLAIANPWFGNRLSATIEGYFDSEMAGQGSNRDEILRNRNRMSLESRIAGAPVQVSGIDRAMLDIPVEVNQYRLIDEENQPYVLILAENRPYEALEQLLGNRNVISDGEQNVEGGGLEELENAIGDYQLQHSFQVYDDQWKIDQQVTFTPELSAEQMTEYEEMVSAYAIRYQDPDNQSVSVELMHQNPDPDDQLHPLLPAGLLGTGKLFTRQPVSLIADESFLEMGDLILGYYDDVPDDYPFDFRVSNDGVIPQNQNLVLHFEVYHLSQDSDGISDYELTYRILPVGRNGRIDLTGREYSLTIGYSDTSSRGVEDLEIDFELLDEGRYEIQVVIEDLLNGQEQNRSTRFRVLDTTD